MLNTSRLISFHFLQMRVFWQYIQGMVSRFNYSPSLTTELIILFSFCSLRTWERYRSLGSIPRSTCLHRVTKERRRTNSKRYSKRSKPRVSFEKLLLDLGRLSNSLPTVFVKVLLYCYGFRIRVTTTSLETFLRELYPPSRPIRFERDLDLPRSNRRLTARVFPNLCRPRPGPEKDRTRIPALLTRAIQKRSLLVEFRA